MQSLSPCFEAFLKQFLEDINIPQASIDKILLYAKKGVSVYDKNKPTNTVSSVITNLYSCGSQQINETLKEISNAALMLQMYISVILIVVTVIIVAVFFLPVRGLIKLLLAVLTLIMAILAVYLLYSNFVTLVDNLLNVREANVETCVNTAESQLREIAEQEKSAINAGLCAYADRSSP
jgi:hypothetical protein